ncbi:MAG: IS1595 family transposase [Fibromonadales bacterium]|nr:IS1595 family transposase [Fibromonadales bacterium]
MDFGARFPDEESAREYLEWQRWGGNPVCPVCGSPAKAWLRKRPGLPDCYSGWYKCRYRKCRKAFTVKHDSIFSHTQIPLHSWLHAIFCLLTELKGKSARQLAKRWAKVKSYKSGWHLGHRIREAMSADKKNAMLDDDVESDESPFGGKRRNKHWDKKSDNKKTWAMGMVERNGGKVVFKVIPDTSKETLLGLLCQYVELGSTVFTDGCPSYDKVESLGYEHHSVIHSKKIYVLGGYVHTNTIESIWRIAKDASRAVYHRPSPKHLHRYLDEIAYRRNNKTTEVPIMDALAKFIDLCWGVSLPWDKLVPKKDKQNYIQELLSV